MNIPLALFNIGPPEMIIIGAIALLIFGPQLPKVARWFGKSVSQFKRGIDEVTDQIMEEPQQQKPQQPQETPPKAAEKKPDDEQLQG